MTTTKTCTKCNQTSAITNFGKDKKGKDGRRTWCKPCTRAYYKAYYKKPGNKERNTERCRQWKQKNKEIYNDYQRSWREDNPARIAALHGKAQSEQRAPGCVPADYDLEQCIPFYEERIRLTEETGIPHHVDHIIPLKKGGTHHQDNLQVLTAAENIRKGSKIYITQNDIKKEQNNMLLFEHKSTAGTAFADTPLEESLNNLYAEHVLVPADVILTDEQKKEINVQDLLDQVNKDLIGLAMNHPFLNALEIEPEKITFRFDES